MFRSSESQNDGDTGPVYVREKGRLFLAGSQPSNVKSCPPRLFSKGFSVELCVKEEDNCKPKEKPFIFTYTEEGSLRYSAKSLFTLALDLIADNIQHVDSLLGFPEQIAERLFTAAESRQQFSKPHSGLVALRKFTEAYGDLMLSSLCLRGKYLLVSEKLEEIKSFQDLCSLDLSCCKLGDDHELLQHITSDTLNSLRELYLRDNCLSDAGIRKMTAPVRILHRGLGSLTLLDLSCNSGITDVGLKFLFVFKQLQFLDLSDTGVQDSIVTRKAIETRMGLLLSLKPLSQFDHIDCTTQGWAEQLLNQWNTVVASAAKPKESLKSRTAAQHFYGKEKVNQRDLQASTINFSAITQFRPLQFYSQDKGISTTLSGQFPVKRTRDDKTQDAVSSAPAKRLCVSLSAEDLNLLNSY
ncbi:leucine-rich repeat-containing protein 42 [Rana temporaria]|uniref:leucine-rich repeat-containing protein 42 n=1 Tax=Rana temporaria TaxID=8407 RepID=UPI001AAE10D0|nr:leucine-rich repeat-containing protein 42 [Rana temporaria]XP_040216373.1 leucine-rich repeat-containing protein 42 [Rana temporaria]